MAVLSITKEKARISTSELSRKSHDVGAKEEKRHKMLLVEESGVIIPHNRISGDSFLLYVSVFLIFHLSLFCIYNNKKRFSNTQRRT